MNRGTIGFGIVGCGMISSWHADAILKIQGARLIGITDVNEKAVADFANKYHVKAFSSIDELLKNDEVNVVCICTPSGLHAPLAIKAASAGKHVIVEKPMAINRNEAEEVVRACETNGVKLAVISQLRFTDAVSKLKNAVDKGMLGRLVSGDIYMKYHRSQEYYDKGGWRGTWKMDGGGALLNQGIHGVDLLQYIMGPVKSVFAYTRTLTRKIEVEDTAAAVLEFRSGALGVIQATTSTYPGSPRKLEICGDRGTIALEEDNIVNWVIEGQESLNREITVRTTSSAFMDPKSISIEGHVRQIGDMVNAIQLDRRPLVDEYEGKKTVEIIMAIYESSKSGKQVEIGI
jgi:UDP-N-acetyl-2-amino-2-deoxyglucuronate dehydrogenase